MEKLLGKTLDELKQVAVECGLRPFVGKQLAEWMYSKKVVSWDGMTNIGNAAKAALGGRYEIGASAPVGSALSSDGTKKYLFPAAETFAVEAVVIPDDGRRTLCVSSQAGCRMGCRFCMTGRQGWHGNLSAADILNQFLSVDEPSSLTNAVFMGMGEPMDNYQAVERALEVLTADWGFAWSPKRITVSTVGVIPTLKQFLDKSRCHLAVSLHNPFPDQRAAMMPVQKAYPLEDVVALLKQYDFTGQRRVSFEYIMFAGVTDTKAHIDALIRLLRGLECRINLIRFHAIPDFPLKPSAAPAIEAFKKRLNDSGITTTLRASRGEDVMAACGLLAGKGLKKN